MLPAGGTAEEKYNQPKRHPLNALVTCRGRTISQKITKAKEKQRNPTTQRNKKKEILLDNP